MTAAEAERLLLELIAAATDAPTDPATLDWFRAKLHETPLHIGQEALAEVCAAGTFPTPHDFAKRIAQLRELDRADNAGSPYVPPDTRDWRTLGRERVAEIRDRLNRSAS